MIANLITADDKIEVVDTSTGFEIIYRDTKYVTINGKITVEKGCADNNELQWLDNKAMKVFWDDWFPYRKSDSTIDRVKQKNSEIQKKQEGLKGRYNTFVLKLDDHKIHLKKDDHNSFDYSPERFLGIYRTEFDIKLDTKLIVNDVISLANIDENSLVIVRANHPEYKVKIVSDVVSSYFPEKYVQKDVVYVKNPRKYPKGENTGIIKVIV